ncbi:ribonuclease Z [Bradyrhizobium sp. i1.8.4]|uniref:MBL fold metallo-hydrolase n=1 Tax=unclassified Bradyrhizobium TaxID=2631580 RepID=UPI003D240ADB
MKAPLFATGLFIAGSILTGTSGVSAAPCLIVTLTGTQGGPQSFNGLAGAGTLVRYGDDADGCAAELLQFDAGRGTTMRLSQLGITPGQLNAVFFTHMHNDHTEGFVDLVQLRWSFNASGPKLDVVCSTDATSPQGATISCGKFTAHVADAFIQSGEIAQRHSEVGERTTGGPANIINTITFEPGEEPQRVWSLGDLKVSAVRSSHIAGHVSYRVDTPAGSVVIGGDASNDIAVPPRNSSTSDQVERLARGADIIVHSAVHPIMAPGRGSGMPAYAYLRQSSVPDLAAMAKRAGARYLMLTHLIPPLGADRQYPFKVPGGPLTETDYRKAAEEGGFPGDIVIGTDLASLRLPAK